MRALEAETELWQIVAPLPIGFIVFLVHLATIPIAGTGINPVRSTPCHSIKYEYNGEARNMVVTRFEVTDARRCFPCWDEPAFKAKFNITLEVLAELVALSNMPVVKETAGLLDVACWVAAL